MAEMSDLPKWIGLGLLTDEPPDLSILKAILFQHGVNSRGWRLYLDHGDAMFNPLRQRWLDGQPAVSQASVAVAWLRLLQACEMDVLPPRELAVSIADWDLPGGQLAAVPPLFLRAAWKAAVLAAYADADVPAFIQAQVIPLAKWFFQSGAFRSAGTDRLKAGWEGLKRLGREHVAEEFRQLSPDDWPPVIRKFESGPFVMRALCNELELQEEGEAMDHCVGTFGDTCRFQPLRIFSIQLKKGGKRVATLAIKETRSGHWDVDQLKGPGNTDPSSLLWQDIGVLLRVVNEVTRQDPKLRRFLDFIHSLAA